MSAEKPLLSVLDGQITSRPPMWIMRQAGRYLPEYREVRGQAKDFLDLCYTPRLATEVTLQPLRRFDLDAAILFSDILVIPDALGQKIAFEQGVGPRLDPITADQIERLVPEKALERLTPVLDTVAGVKAALAPEKALLGFCGAPWTVATYMIGGKGSTDQAAARLFALQEPDAFGHLIDVLVQVSIDYLAAQIDAGADAVQIFESWALNLDEQAFADYVVAPNKRIVAGVREKHPDARIIGFPRGAAGLVGTYAEATRVNAVGLDFSMPVAFADQLLPKSLPVQGNLDPLRLVSGGEQMEARAREIIAGFSSRPHIFNLGHGIVPQTPIEHVARLVKLVKEGK